MKDYRLFEITDFVLDDDFIRWVFDNNAADNNFWNNWLRQNPGKHLLLAEARQILLSLKIEQETVSEEKIESEVEKLLQTIRLQPQQSEELPPRLNVSRKWWYAAASIAIVVLAGAFYFNNRQPKLAEGDQFKYISQVSSRQLLENINTSEKEVKINLPDGSVVHLAPNSHISYSNSFDTGSTRDVFLSGEAFFSVVKNPAQPFRVFSNEIITKVLGTTFTVRSFDTDSVIQIIVKTGKVSVYTQTSHQAKEIASKKLGGILLTSNQQLVYAKIGQTFQKIIAESPAMVAPSDFIEQRMAYEDVPLEEVFNQLSRAYGIEILYDNELLKNCTVTADIRNETFYRQLDLICDAVGAKYELMDGQVVIQSKGCQ